MKYIIKVTILHSVICYLTMEKPVYNRIKAVLAERRKTNNWLADQLEVNRTTVSKWCRNEMQPRVETLFNIAKVLEVDVRELLTPKE